jgi:hypothetical protein
LVLGPDGKAAPGILVRATWAADQGRQARTDARGLFALCGLPSGQTMEVRFSNGSATIAERTLALERKEYRWLDLHPSGKSALPQ